MIEFWKALRSGNRVRRSRRARDIVGEIQHQIAEGVLVPGAQLPTLRELSLSHRVPIQTIQECLQLLRRDGYVRGTRIADKAAPGFTQRVLGALASSEPLDVADAAALEILLQSCRVGRVAR